AGMGNMQASQLLARARRLRLTPRLAAAAPLAGEYRGAYPGAGMEYEESREYAPGDDVAAMDWKATARLGRPFVKRFREERSLTLMLAVDVSPSMTCPCPREPLYWTAALAAVTLAVSAAVSRDRIGLVLFTDQVEAFLPPRAGPAVPVAVARLLAETRPQGRGTDPGPALSLAATALVHRSAVMLFSDFLSGDFAVPLGRLAARHDVAAGFVVPDDDACLPPAGLAAVADPEDGRPVVIDCAAPAARACFVAARQAR
ncbi:MAG: hypothetical protein B193_3953, partial [Solidesulfovibrio magneticus str. Maddingley MBC34]